MLKGDAAVQKSGIIPIHSMTLLEIAQEYHCAILFYPVSLHATGLIKEGYLAKKDNLKAHLADWGPQAGFICLEQKYSSIAKSENEKIAKSNSETQSAIRTGNALALPLIISSERVDYLFRSNIVCVSNYQNGYYRVYSPQHAEINFVLYPHRLQAFGDFPDTNENPEIFHRNHLQFENFPQLFNGYWVFVEKEGKLQTLWVLADPFSCKPFTSGYSLLTVCAYANKLLPQLENQASQTKIESESRHFTSLIKASLKQKEKKISQIDQEQIQHLTRLVNNQINLRIYGKATTGKALTKYESVNELHYPITCFTPWGEMVAACDLFQLQAILRDITRTGFVYDINGLLSQHSINQHHGLQDGKNASIDNLEVLNPPKTSNLL